MNELQHIQALDDEVSNLADWEAKLERYARREKPGEHRQIVEEQLRHVRQRLDHAQAERRELVASRQLQIARARRRALHNEIPRPVPVRFYEITEVAA